jgi:hypothetical protein
MFQVERRGGGAGHRAELLRAGELRARLRQRSAGHQAGDDDDEAAQAHRRGRYTSTIAPADRPARTRCPGEAAALQARFAGGHPRYDALGDPADRPMECLSRR